MSARLAAALALAALSALAAAPARGQQPEAQEAETKRDPRLTLDIGAEQAYESNVPFTEVLGQDDFVTRGTVRLTAVLPIRRGEVELAGDAGANVYRTVKGLDRYTWGALGRIEHRFSRRTELELLGRSSKGYARDNPRLEVAGTLAPLTLTRSDTGEGRFRQRLGRALDLRLDARAESFRFESPVLQDGWTLAGRLGLENGFTPSFALGLEGSYARTGTSEKDPLAGPGAPAPPEPLPYLPGTEIEVAAGVATLRLRFARGVELRGEGGVAHFRPVGVRGGNGGGGAPGNTVPDEPRTTATFAGTFSVNRGAHTFSALGSRRVEQTYGIGAIGINRVVGVEYRLALARWVTWLAQGTNNENRAPDGFVLSTGFTLTTGFDCALPADFGTRLTYSYWDRDDPARDWHSHTVAFGLTKRFTWR